MYLLDTNIVSELMKAEANENVLGWLKTVAFEKLYISTLNVAEISRGIEKLEASNKQATLRQALEMIRLNFAERILDLDYTCATQFGLVTSRNEKKGLPMHPFDALLLASAERHGLHLVTRNTKHFADRTPLTIINPFEEGAST